MTNQEAFDKVLTHLRKQGKAAVGENENSGDTECLYRSEQADGTVLMCAAGCLLPDELYHRNMEGIAVSDYPEIFVDKLGLDIGLLRQMQSAHDDYLWKVSIDAWEKEMQRIAMVNSLHYKEPK